MTNPPPRNRRLPTVLSLVVAALLAGVAPGRAFERTEQRAPCAERFPLKHPFFGDLHVHTAYSLDASTQGTRALPEDAYRFAQGGTLPIQPYDAEGNALRALRLERPLDFMAVTDHAELFGELEICRDPSLAGHGSVMCRLYRWWPRLAFFVMNSRATRSEQPQRFRFCGEDGQGCIEAARGPWQRTLEAAEAAYDRSSACRFTTFAAYEWTGGPGTNNIHRNVIFRNGAVPPLPVTYLDEPRPEGLWRRLDEVCRENVAGCDYVSIPHNSNISGGLMFAAADEGKRAADARGRAAAEPIVEIMQHKGDSECRLGPESEDERCGFAKLPYPYFQGKYVGWLADSPGRLNYVRNALREGLLVDAKIGANPYKLGIIGSTDTHLGAAGFVREDAHPGHGGAGAASPGELPRGFVDDVEFNPGGLAVLWAEENSRDALFASLRRREVYGTSGPRMIVRFFGGWGYPDDLCDRDDLVAIGYGEGVPMGADLPERPTGADAPAFVVAALRDPGTKSQPGTPLQRLQIVKAWVEGDSTREAVYDVAGSAAAGRVDPASCVTDGGGFDRLCSVWRDPDFDPGADALYYVRALESPVCRWSSVACLRAGVDCSQPGDVAAELAACCDESVPRTIQERAWTSPVWYEAGGA